MADVRQDHDRLTEPITVALDHLLAQDRFERPIVVAANEALDALLALVESRTQERDNAEATLAAVKRECDLDLNCGVDCDCESYDDMLAICLAHRILAVLSAVAKGEQ